MALSDFQDLTGYLAAALTTTSFVPQVLHTWHTRSAHDVSLGMYLAFTAGVGFWLIYGFMVDSWRETVKTGNAGDGRSMRKIAAERFPRAPPITPHEKRSP